MLRNLNIITTTIFLVLFSGLPGIAMWLFDVLRLLLIGG